jgi:hypothetical protein
VGSIKAGAVYRDAGKAALGKGACVALVEAGMVFLQLAGTGDGGRVYVGSGAGGNDEKVGAAALLLHLV